MEICEAGGNINAWFTITAEDCDNASTVGESAEWISMFLFTSLPEPTRQAVPAAYADALQRAADSSGVSFDYLVATAKRESGFRPNAAAPTSSARGMFQFIEQTWLRMVRSEGANVGLGAEASAISIDSSGNANVTDAATRQAILDLRNDPAVSAQMAARLAKQNGEKLSAALGRDASAGDLYAAHFLGASAAAKLIGAAETTPNASAADMLPAAARANSSIFYDANGNARGAADVVARIKLGFEGAGQGVTSTASTLATGPTFHSLFRTGGPSPVSSEIAGLWRSRAGATQPMNINPSRTIRSNAA